MRWTVDVGTQVPHAALRTYVMGDRGADVEAAATTDEIEQMSRLCEAAIRAERLSRLRDPEVRRTLLAEHAESIPSGFVGILHSGYDRVYPLSDPPNYEPTPAKRCR